MQEKIHLLRCYPHNRLFAIDQPFFRHINGNTNRSPGGSFPVAGLQHPELAFFNGKLHVLHIPIIIFELPGDGLKLFISLRHFILKLRQILGHPDAGHNVLALGIDQVITLHLVIAGIAVARHGNARSAVIAHISKNHGYDTDGGAQVMRNACGLTVVIRTLAVPALEHGLRGQLQLDGRISRKIVMGIMAVDLLELPGDGFPVFRGQFGLVFYARPSAGCRENLLEDLVLDAHHHAAEHLDQAAVGIVGESGIIGQFGHALGRFIVEPDI